MNGAMVKFAAAVAGAALLGGCVGLRDHRGAVIDEELVSAVQVGVDNKASVEKTLGRPTFTGQFTQNDWYYVSRDTGTVAFRSPRVREQTVLHVNFDQAGNVAAIRKSGKELIASINPANARTPTLGRKKSFFEDIFGNIGSVGSGGTGLPSPNEQ
ncbi:MAG: outer membrane protein assembly factor BamE [Sphingomonas sp.]|jgi:outer membrane protein assembly factor BamE (lipoprotein component of BamABCDE complex)|nr:outer membrane protein assembly factor BamE [Sphingomonas sp.]